MRNKLHASVVGLCLMASLLFGPSALAQDQAASQAGSTSVPNLIRYSGTLKNIQGAASVAPSTVGVTFSIYKQQDGGAPVWQEVQNVTPDANGQYSILLGSTTASGLPDDLFSQQEQRWLSVQVQGQEEQARVLLVSVPYAFKAHEAETLGGLPASAFLKALPTEASSSASADVGTAVNALSNSVNANIRSKGKSTGPSSNSTICSALTANGSANYMPVFDPTVCNLTNSLLFQDSLGTVVNDSASFNLSNAGLAYRISGINVLAIGSGPSLATFSSVFVGVGAGSNNQSPSGMNNTFVGYNAGMANTGQSNNTFIGFEAGLKNTALTANTFIGSNAGMMNDSGVDNTFLGFKAGSANTGGSDNTFVGFQAGLSNGSTAGNNTFTGSNAGRQNVTGVENVFSGTSAGVANVGGFSDTFIGFQSGVINNDGHTNTFVGHGAGRSNVGGSDNVVIGSEADTSGSQNIAIGHQSSAGGANNICIGNGVGCGGNNTIHIGNGAATDTTITGIYGQEVPQGREVVCTGGGTATDTSEQG